MTRVIFHGDDFGLTHAFNAGIIGAYREGVLRSASIRADGTALEEAVEMIGDADGLSVGLHINLVEGKSHRRVQKTDRLCHMDGRYRRGFPGLYSALHFGAAERLKQNIEDEIRDQLEQLLQKGVPVDHLDSHQQTHNIPALFELTCRMAQQYRIPAVRFVNEPFFLGPVGSFLPVNSVKHVLLNRFAKTNATTAGKYHRFCNDEFLGVLYTGFQDLRSVYAGLRAVTPGSLVLVLLHPCLPTPHLTERFVAPYLEAYTRHPARRTEFDTLTSPDLMAYLKRHEIRVTSFAEECARRDEERIGD